MYIVLIIFVILVFRKKDICHEGDVISNKTEYYCSLNLSLVFGPKFVNC